MKEKHMKNSEIVEKLKEFNSVNPIKVEKEGTGIQALMTPKEELVNKAYQNLCDMWNKSEGLRNFIKHLMTNFLPYNPMSKIFSYEVDEAGKKINNVCAILSIKTAGIDEITDYLTKFSMERMRINAQAMSEKREKLTEAEVKALNKIKNSAPIEVRNCTIGYGSTKSTKILSGEAYLALYHFASNCILHGEKEVEFAMKKKMFKEGQRKFKKETRLNDSEVNRVIKASTYSVGSALNESTLSKLEGLRDQLNKKG